MLLDHAVLTITVEIVMLGLRTCALYGNTRRVIAAFVGLVLVLLPPAAVSECSYLVYAPHGLKVSDSLVLFDRAS